MPAMGKKIISNLIFCFVVSIITFSLNPNNSYAQEKISIVIAPNIVAMNSMGTTVTVHTNVAIGNVDITENVLLIQITDTEDCNLIDETSYIEMSRYEVDDLGNFVAKFLMDDFKAMALCVNEINTFRLEGYTKAQELFYGTDTVLINGSNDSEDPVEPVEDQYRHRENENDTGNNGGGRKGWL